MTKQNLILSQFNLDQGAVYFFKNHVFDNGRDISVQNQNLYVINASVLNVIKKIQFNQMLKNKLLGRKKTGFWSKISLLVTCSRESLGHSLPTSHSRLKGIYEGYVNSGYCSLISTKYGNSNSRKVGAEIEQLVLDISKQIGSTKTRDLLKAFDQFRQGTLDVLKNSGEEVYRREDIPNLDISKEALLNNLVHIISHDEVKEARVGEEQKLSNEVYSSLILLNPDLRIKLLKQFLALIDLVK
ncbi:hypothetical protein SAMN05660841_00003 [Sphingobacterium nematocida]|uniref:Uncharacterized protein n=1 Tax=Sphingobacterium nematocida TaxID=1513896 RepID=A0A1T5ALY7_9SPHI|nr:hypothetical protein [Sphingobacterium nematocida]SKB36022.1 hypothetical protein SAMN05660841_00003 [Sphingobacterium nematocida]